MKIHNGKSPVNAQNKVLIIIYLLENDSKSLSIQVSVNCIMLKEDEMKLFHACLAIIWIASLWSKIIHVLILVKI